MYPMVPPSGDEEQNDAVESQDQVPVPVGDDLVTVDGYRIAFEAEMARAFLEASGIPAFVNDAETVTMDWLLGNAVGNIKLQVSASRVEEAKALLSNRPRTEAPTEEAGLECLSCGAAMDPSQSKCPACGWSYHDPDTTSSS